MNLARHVRLMLTVLFVAVALPAAHAQVGQWVNKAHMLQARYDFAAATGADGKIYVFGGQQPFSTLTLTLTHSEVYDPETDSWSQIAQLPEQLIRHSAVGLPDGRILVVGLNSGSQDFAYLYDPATDSFSVASHPNWPFSGRLAAAMGNDGKAVVIGTAPNVGGNFVSVFEYNIASNTWQSAPQAPFQQQHPVVASDDSGLVYLALGRILVAPGGYATATWAFDDNAHAWSSFPSVATSRDFPAGTFGGDGRLYVAGGRVSGSEDGTKLVEAFNPSTGSWSPATNLNWQRREAAAARDSDGRVYVLGGRFQNDDDLQALNSVECYQPSLLLGDGEDISAVEGTSFTGKVATFKDKGPTQNAIEYTAAIDWGDGASTVANVVAGANPGEFNVNAAHTYSTKGDYMTSIEINDSDGDAVTLSGFAVVEDAPITGDAIDFTASSGVLFTRVIAHFEDGNPLETGETFMAVVDWGDGSKVSPQEVIVNTEGGFDVRGGHRYNNSGIYTFVVSAPGGPYIGTATVTPPPPVVTANGISAVEGALFSGKVAGFTNADPNIPHTSFEATVDWGDGSTSTGIVGPDFTVKGSHTYVKFGVYTLKVTVNVQGGVGNSSTDHATISNAAISATGFNLTAKGTNFSNTVATFTDGNPFSVAADFSAEIFWGDGKSSVGTVVAAGAGFKVVGSHSYAKRGKYTITVSIRDQGGANANATTQINVGPVK